jgi:uncharacterized membrane protein
MNGEAIENKEFLCEWRASLALGEAGQVLWIGLLLAPLLVMSAVFAWWGAWPVVPFAGIEGLGVVTAFSLMRWRGRQVERFRLKDGGFAWERWSRGRLQAMSGNFCWARLDLRERRSRTSIELGYAGRWVEVATQLADADKREFFRELKRRQACLGSGPGAHQGWEPQA